MNPNLSVKCLDSISAAPPTDNLFYLFLATLGLRCCVRAFSSCSKQGERGLLFVAVCRLLIAVASLVAKHGL